MSQCSAWLQPLIVEKDGKWLSLLHSARMRGGGQALNLENEKNENGC